MPRSFGTFDSQIRDAIAKSFLAEASPKAIDRLLDSARLIQVPAGSVVYRPYEPGEAAIILSGFVRAYLTSPEGRQITVKYGVPGEIFGFPLLVSGPVPVSVQVIQGGAGLFLDPEVLENLCVTEPKVGWQLAQEVGAEFHDLIVTLAENLFNTVPSKLAHHLLALALPDGDRLVVKQTQKDLADAVGSVREVISRTLNKFHSEGLIEMRPQGIVLLDLPKLKAVIRIRN